MHFNAHDDIDGLAQDWSNQIANALELLPSCAKPSIFLWCFEVAFIDSSYEVLVTPPVTPAPTFCYCENGGYCSNRNDPYSCVCPEYYSGRVCEIREYKKKIPSKHLV